jgi:hypothetical protein
MTHRVSTDRWILMGRQVIAELIAGRRERMRADEALNGR